MVARKRQACGHRIELKKLNYLLAGVLPSKWACSSARVEKRSGRVEN